MTVSAFEHPFLSSLAGDDEVAALLSIDVEIAAMLAFEHALAAAEAEHGVIPAEAASAIGRAIEGFIPDIGALRESTARDGVVVPEFVRQLKRAVGSPYESHLHFGATSQDLIDTALVLRLKPVIDCIAKRIDALDGAFANLAGRFGSNPLMGRTRMQAAIMVTVADRVESWRAPLARHRERLDNASAGFLVVQLGGAAGTLDRFGGKGAAVRASLAGALEIGEAPQWHNQRDRIVAFADVLSLITGSLGKFGQDVALLTQDGTEVALAGGGGSSAMPHKQNPVQAELLVTLARYNATQLSGMHHALIHEQERSGAAWTLEWLILPQMVLAAATATRTAAQLIGNITQFGH